MHLLLVVACKKRELGRDANSCSLLVLSLVLNIKSANQIFPALWLLAKEI